MPKMTALILLLALSSVMLAGQEKKTQDSVLEEWEQTLKYGIDTQIIEVIKKIKDFDEQSLNGELVSILAKSANPAVRKEILSFFTGIKYADAEPVAYTILTNYENEEADLVRSLIGYLSEIRSMRSLAIIIKLIDAEENLTAYSAITAVGRMGDASQVTLLLQKLSDPEIKSDRKPTIIKALGDLKAGQATAELLKIVQDRDMDHVWRMYACESLGKIGDAAAVPVLKSVFAENDPLLKAYAAGALANFDLALVLDILIEGLKDSYWKVRVAACQGLARPGATRAVDILIYKVNKDPEMPVKIEAMKALGEIGTGQSFAFLRQVFEDKGKTTAVREFAFTTLCGKNLVPETAAAIERVVAQEWDSKDKKLLESVSRKLMTTESPYIKKVLSLFLNHPSFIIRIAGIRGISKNRYYDLRGRIEELEKKDSVEAVRKEAKAALEKM